MLMDYRHTHSFLLEDDGELEMHALYLHDDGAS